MTLSRRDLDEIADEVEASYDPATAQFYRPRYNVAPTDRHPMVVWEGARRLQMGTWGFSAAEGRPLLINARAETAPFKDAFREAFLLRRCVIPADGFYEWSGAGEARQPFHIKRPDGRLLLFAGLYQQAADGTRRFTVLTTEPNAVVSRIHDRMPVILPDDAVQPWLVDGGTRWLRTAADDALAMAPASARVNSVKNDDPGCLTPEPKRQLTLF